jgi:hypothetical protein
MLGFSKSWIRVIASPELPFGILIPWRHSIWISQLVCYDLEYAVLDLFTEKVIFYQAKSFMFYKVFEEPIGLSLIKIEVMSKMLLHYVILTYTH